MKHKKGSEFSEERETRVLLEDLGSQFRVFGEGMHGMNQRLGRIEDKVERLDSKVDRLEIKVDHLGSKVDQLQSEVHHLQVEMSFVMKVLPTVATKDDLKQFEKRLNALEAAS